MFGTVDSTAITESRDERNGRRGKKREENGRRGEGEEDGIGIEGL